MSGLDEIDEIEEIEVELLLSGIFKRYGYDFRNYAPASIRRRVQNFVRTEGFSSISAGQEGILHDPKVMDRFIRLLTVNTTSMFRDPAFYKALREEVVPILKTYPLVRIWHAGCSTGEEVYSTAILLKEEGLYDRCRIYATDLNDEVLHKAKSGIFPLQTMKEYTDNYMKSGGTTAFSEYYTAKFDHAILNSALRQNVVFAQHNLVTDRSFNEFNLVLVRNVLIYFNEELREKVLALLHGSLSMFGVLALGKRETLRYTKLESCYEELNSSMKLYRRCG